MIEKHWQLLAIEATTDKALIRKAYRTQLPLHHPETDPDGFKALREAYEYALHYADFPESESTDNLNYVVKSAEITKPLSEEEQAVNQICQQYEALLQDPKRCYDINAWHQFVASFYDYPIAVIDQAKWQLLDLSYNASYLSLLCAKVLAESLRWRQQLMTLSPDKVEFYDGFLSQVERGDSFDYASLPTDNKAIQDATLDYIGMAKWLFWERPVAELAYYLAQDTVIYLPDDSEFMAQFANWHVVANTDCAAILEYSLLQIAQLNENDKNRVEWQHVAARQYSLLDDKENALKYWLELYYSGHYQEKAIAWLIYWCSQHAPNHLPLLVFAVNQSNCVPATSTENIFYAIPKLSPTTVARLTKLKKEDYPSEIADFITWGTSINWGYRQILQLLLRDNGDNQLFRLYRHAVMIKHGNETLLQAVLDDYCEDPFEQFILHHLQRQARQHIAWLTELPIVQQFKAWLYNTDRVIPLPEPFIPEDEDNQFFFARMWLDRFRYMPYSVLMRLYDNLVYANMEMFDWSVFLASKEYCIFPMPLEVAAGTTTQETNESYWQWYRYCMLVMGLAIDPSATAKYLQQDRTFNVPTNSPIFSLVQTVQNRDWQDDAQLYSVINNDNKMVNCILLSLPSTMEYFIDNIDRIDFADIQQKTQQIWQTKLANSNPVYLMLLQMILLHKPEQKTQLSEALKAIAGDSAELKKVQDAFEKGFSYPFSSKKDNYNFTKQADAIKTLTERLAMRYGQCDDDEFSKLPEFKDNGDNDLVLRLCAALILQWDTQKQQALIERNLPANKTSQFWRWNGRTTIKGFLRQLSFSFFLFLFMVSFVRGFGEQINIAYIIYGIAGINAIFAIRRRLNDVYSGEAYFRVASFISLFLLLLPCWEDSITRTNRYGPPVEK